MQEGNDFVMQPDLQDVRFYVGLKQSTEAIKNGKAARAFVANDADDHVRLPFVMLCEENGIPLEICESKAKLGKNFGISVSAACAVILK